MMDGVTFTRRSLLAGAAGIGCLAVAADFPASRPSAPTIPVARGKAGWNQLALGPWGFVTGLQFDASGNVAVCSTDAGGAYVAEAPAFHWRQLITPASLPRPVSDYFGEDHPVEEGGFADSAGVYAVAIAPSDPARLYITWKGFVLRSDDRGRSWVRTGLAPMKFPANGPRSKLFNPKLVVDPINPAVVYVAGSDSGIWRTLDAGRSWRQVLPVAPKAQHDGSWALLAIDPSAGKSGSGAETRSSRIYVASAGNGFYRSLDGGEAFALVDQGVQSVSQLAIDSAGAVYACDVASGQLKRWEGEAFRTIAIPGLPGVHAIAIDPADRNRLVVFSGDGFNALSTDRGTSWTEVRNSGVNRKNAYSWDFVAADVPALAVSEDFAPAASVLFRPGVKNELWCPLGIGVARCRYPDGALSASNRPVFESVSAGIEELVVRQILAAPGMLPIVGCWDRPLFRIADPERFPPTYGPDPALRHAASIDYAKDGSRTLAALVFHWGRNPPGYSSFSEDGGASWKRFDEQPLAVEGASMAVGRKGNIVVFPQANSVPKYTLDNGRSWTDIVFPAPGIPKGEGTGFGFGNNSQNRQIATHDGEHFFVYNYGSENPVFTNSLVGVWRSTDGRDWTRVYSRSVAAFATYHSTLRAVFGRPKNLFFSAGDVGGDVNPANTDFMFSNDGGVSWAAIKGFKEVKYFDVGKPVAPGSYPAIYALGYYRNRMSVWRCLNFDPVTRAGEWSDIGQPDTVATATCLAADKDFFGRVFLGTSGSGAFYGNFA